MTRVSRLRSCLRLPFPLGAGFGGLTISLEGGLDEVDEFFFARARSASSFSTRAASLGGLLFELSTSWAAARLGIVHDENNLPANAESAKSNPRGRERLP